MRCLHGPCDQFCGRSHIHILDNPCGNGRNFMAMMKGSRGLILHVNYFTFTLKSLGGCECMIVTGGGSHAFSGRTAHVTHLISFFRARVTSVAGLGPSRVPRFLRRVMRSVRHCSNSSMPFDRLRGTCISVVAGLRRGRKRKATLSPLRRRIIYHDGAGYSCVGRL